MKIIEIKFKNNWGNPQNHKVGEHVEKIEEHMPQGEGDKWFYDVIFNDGRTDRIFNVTRAVFQNVKPTKTERKNEN